MHFAITYTLKYTTLLAPIDNISSTLLLMLNVSKSYFSGVNKDVHLTHFISGKFIWQIRIPILIVTYI